MPRRIRRRPGHRIAVGSATMVMAMTVAACSTGRPSAPPAEYAEEMPPAIVHSVVGSSLHRLLLSPHAIARLGIRTEQVQPGLIPATAVTYDNNGQSWTYTNPAPRTYVRAAVSIGAVSGGAAVLLSGPPPGTAVVTVGTAELVGVEYGVGGEQK